MTVTIWFAALAAVALGASLPAFAMRRGAGGYPLAGNVLVGLAVVALGLLAPAALAPHWTPALIALFLTAMIPLGVDALLDRDPAPDAGWEPAAGPDPDDGDGGSGVAALAASTAALSAATCAMNAAVTVALIH